MRSGGSGATKAQRNRAVLERAINHFYGGQQDAAADLCRDILKSDKRNAGARYLLGVISHQQGQPKIAMEQISKSLKLEPANPDAHNYLGVVFAETGRHGDAVKHFRRAVSLKSDFAEAYNNLGNALRQMGRQEDAVVNFQTAINLVAGYVEAHNGLGLCLRDMGQTAEAAVHLRKAIEINPNHADALFNLGNLLDAQELHGEAAECFQAVVSISPDLREAYYHLVNSLLKLGRFTEGLNWARKIVSLEPEEAKAHYYLGFALAAIEQHDEAAGAFEKALELCDDTAITIRTLFGLSRLPTLQATPRHLSMIDGSLVSLNDEGIPDEEENWAALLGFARAGILHKLGQNGEAWQALRDVNARYDEGCRDAWSVDLSLYENVLAAARERAGKTGAMEGGSSMAPVPLFVLGPSRSGKSTVEKLLGCLPGVMCGYEDPIIQNVLGHVAAETDSDAAPVLSELPAELHGKFGEKFADAVTQAAQGNRVLTNTNPAQIMDAAWIAEIIPAARFIFVSRNRDDVAFRIFATLYSPGSNNYAYDLKKIDSYLDWYGQVTSALAFAMGDRVLSLDYEDIIGDPAAVLDTMATFLELENNSRELPSLGDDRGVSAPYTTHMESDAAQS